MWGLVLDFCLFFLQALLWQSQILSGRAPVSTWKAEETAGSLEEVWDSKMRLAESEKPCWLIGSGSATTVLWCPCWSWPPSLNDPPTSSWSRWGSGIYARYSLFWLAILLWLLSRYMDEHGIWAKYPLYFLKILTVGWRDCSVVKSTDDSQKGSSSVPSIHIAAHNCL